MRIYIVEVEGRGPVAVFNAGTEYEAYQFIEKDYFRADLMLFENEGKPIWDGKSELSVRAAQPKERVEFSESIRALQEKQIDDFDDQLVQFLIPISDPTDEDDGAA
jgi:hypothetical protein